MSLKVYALEGCPFSIATVNLLKQINPNIEIVKVKRSEKDEVKKLIDHPTFPCTKLILNDNNVNIGGNDIIEFLVNSSSDLQKICSSDKSDFKLLVAKISVKTKLSRRNLCNFYNALFNK